jgi:hypothetical protein
MLVAGTTPLCGELGRHERGHADGRRGHRRAGGHVRGGKRDELEFREEERQLRDEEGDGAPPRSRVDLDGGTAVLNVPARRQAGQALPVVFVTWMRTTTRTLSVPSSPA